jgi:predicted nucleic acid-binding protein
MEIFDMQLVATMLSHGVSRIYTYNINDFKKYTEIEVPEP